MAFLRIIEDSKPFEWSPIDPGTGQRMEAVFTLRVLPQDVLKTLRQTATRRVYDQHQPVDRLDDLGLGKAIVDYAIVSWTGVKPATSDEDLPCTADMKDQLPEVVKAEIVRLCAGKEAGGEVARAEQEKKRSAPISNAKPTPSTVSPVV